MKFLIFLVSLLVLLLVSGKKFKKTKSPALPPTKECAPRDFIIPVTKEECAPGFGKTNKKCFDLAKRCFCQLEIPMKWTGKGCVQGGVGDGGCQCLDYCGYLCEQRCSADPRCTWSFDRQECSNIFSGITGFLTQCHTTTFKPTQSPIILPTTSPTSSRPTRVPTTSRPTGSPTAMPTQLPSMEPTLLPTQLPSKEPTLLPTQLPSKEPTKLPTQLPSFLPTFEPTVLPTKSPTNLPSMLPTKVPTNLPTKLPTMEPTFLPTKLPTNLPTTTRTPTKLPTRLPTLAPSNAQPTHSPSSSPTCYKVPVADILWIMDKSESITSNQYRKLKMFVHSYTAGLDRIQANFTRVGLIEFAMEVMSEISFNSPTASNQTAILEAIEALTVKTIFGTRTNLALDRATELLLESDRPHSNKVVILATDGMPTNINGHTTELAETMTNTAALNLVQQTNATLVVVRIGSFKPGFLRPIADFMIDVDNFDALMGVLDNSRILCATSS